MANVKTEKKVEEVAKAPLSDFIITREKFRDAVDDKAALYGYVIKDKLLINGQERSIRIDFSAKDAGGYEMLDIIFMISDYAYLLMHDETMTDNDGRKSKYRVYEIVNEDDYGIRYAYKVKPSRESDKALLDVLIQQRNVFIENIEVNGGVANGVAIKVES